MWSSWRRRSPSSISRASGTSRGAVDQAELHPHVGVAAIDRLQHQELVEVGVEQRADDRVDPPGVVVDAGGDVGHAAAPPPAAMLTPPERICRMRRRERAVEVDRPAGVLEQRDLEVVPERVDRRPGDAEVGGEPGEPHPPHARGRAGSRRGRSASRGRSRRRPSSCRSPAGSPCAPRGRRRRCRDRGGTRRPASPARSAPARAPAARRASRSRRRRRRRDGWRRRTCGRRGCQSWVKTRTANAGAMRLTSGTTRSPSATASAPPGQKSFCTSMTMSASAEVSGKGRPLSRNVARPG